MFWSFQVVWKIISWLTPWVFLHLLKNPDVLCCITTGSGCKMSSRIVFKALASYACHGAIRFGDRISMDRCRELVRDLGGCKLPFQCAHGRPSIAPLLKLEVLQGLVGKRKRRWKPDLSKLKKCWRLFLEMLVGYFHWNMAETLDKYG